MNIHLWPSKALNDQFDWIEWRSAAEQIGRDLLAGLDQTLHRADRLVECFAILAGQFDLDNALDPLRSDHGGHAGQQFLPSLFLLWRRRPPEHPTLVL